MFSKSRVNHRTIWHNSGMNDNQMNNKVVITDIHTTGTFQ